MTSRRRRSRLQQNSSQASCLNGPKNQRPIFAVRFSSPEPMGAVAGRREHPSPPAITTTMYFLMIHQSQPSQLTCMYRAIGFSLTLASGPASMMLISIPIRFEEEAWQSSPPMLRSIAYTCRSTTYTPAGSKARLTDPQPRFKPTNSIEHAPSTPPSWIPPRASDRGLQMY